MDNNIHNELRKAIEENRLIIFVGAGLSIRFGLPNWKKLVIDSIKLLDDEAYLSFIPLIEKNKLSLLNVLEAIKDEQFVVKKYVKDNYILEPNESLFLHKKILDLSKKIITTNYDNAFELVDSKIVPTVNDSTFNIANIKNSDEYIFKIHGCAKNPDSCVIFPDSYKKLYESDSSAIEKLKSIFADNVFLFIGFSFSDPYVKELFDWLDKIFKGYNKHFIITNNAENINNINYLRPIEISNDSVEEYIDCLLRYKNSLIDKKKKVDVIEKESENEASVFVKKVALLLLNPLDIEIGVNLSKIQSYFSNLGSHIYTGYLNLKTLQLLQEFDCVIIASDTFKGKIYIENDNLKSTLINVADLVNYLYNDNITYIIVTDSLLTVDSAIDQKIVL